MPRYDMSKRRDPSLVGSMLSTMDDNGQMGSHTVARDEQKYDRRSTHPKAVISAISSARVTVLPTIIGRLQTRIVRYIYGGGELFVKGNVTDASGTPVR